MSAPSTPTPEGGALSPDEIIRIVRWNIRDAKSHGKGPPKVSFGLHVAESIISALRAEKRAEVSAAVRSHDALVAALLTVRDDPGFEAQHGTDFARHVDSLLKAAKGEA